MSATFKAPTPASVSEALTHEFYRLIWWGAVLLATMSILLGVIWHWQAALQWLLQAGPFWAFICYQAGRRLPLNRSDLEAPLYKELGLANRLTLLRALLIASVAGFLFQSWPEGSVLAWLPGMLYFCAAILDRVDGYVARRTKHGSILGSELDTVSDALGLAVASLLAFNYGQVHWTYLLLGIAYYFFHGGILWRKRHGQPVHPLPPSIHRRAWAGFQMGFLVVALWPVFYPPITIIAGFAFMLPALIGFFLDWLIVSGRVNREAEAANNLLQRLTVFSQAVLQPTLRVVVVVTLIMSLLQSGLPPLRAVPWMNNVMIGGFILTSSMVLLGVAGRYFSLLLIGLLGWYYITNPLLAVDYVLFCSLVWLLLLGTGRFSLWQEDDYWINRYDGT